MQLDARPAIAVGATFVERGGPGRMVYEGVSIEPALPKAGDVMTLRHVWRVERAYRSDPAVFVHIERPGGERLAVDDHAPILGKVSLSSMKAGERWVDEHRVSLPARLEEGTLEVWTGLFSGELRMTLEAKAGANDGRDRLRAARIRVKGQASTLPIATIQRATGPIAADGALNEADWAKAEVLTLSDSLGRNVPTRFATKLRLLYDDENLYVAFEAADVDITERFRNRDDPIYDHEAVELFIMPFVAAPGTGPYVELQASPTGVIFDASFTGPRQGMDKSFNAKQVVGTQRRGTLDDNAPDEGWTSEWVVPFTSLRGVNRAPKAGDEWRMNAFRIEKFREGGQQQGEYTAWSPPKVGDFHAVRRFGRMRFAGP